MYLATLCTKCDSITVRANFCRCCGGRLSQHGRDAEVCECIQSALADGCYVPLQKAQVDGHQITILDKNSAPDFQNN